MFTEVLGTEDALGLLSDQLVKVRLVFLRCFDLAHAVVDVVLGARNALELTTALLNFLHLLLAILHLFIN